MLPELEKYSLIRKIGDGAFGSAYLATPRNSESYCVVKITSKALPDNEKSFFHREIDIIRRLTHPGVLKVLDWGFLEDNAFLVTEYMGGGTLEDKIQQEGQLAISYVIDVGITIATILDFLNQQNIVHRDIKPSNIFISRDGILKLGDFGLAKSTENAGKSGLTAPGMGRGTLEYVPLEQLENAVFADTRSDLYSLGATLYEAIAGTPPHQGKSTVEILTSIYRGLITPLTEIRKKTPRTLNDAVMKLLSKDPQKRFQNPGELIEYLKNCRSEFC